MATILTIKFEPTPTGDPRNAYVAGRAGVDSYPFNAPFTTATDVGNLSFNRYSLAGHTSDTHGYTSGGEDASPPFNVTRRIDRFPFTAPFTSASSVGDLSIERMRVAGMYSSTNGYTSEGYRTTPFVYASNTDRFPFALSTTNGIDIGDMSFTRARSGGHSSDTNGYVSAGFNAPVTYNRVDLIPFAGAFSSTTSVGTLTTPKQNITGHSSDTDGYVSGGSNPGAGNLSTVESFPFATPFGTATNVGDLTQAKFGVAGNSSTLGGYTSGGRAPSFVSVVERFPFNTTSTSSTNIGNLSTPTSEAAGQMQG